MRVHRGGRYRLDPGDVLQFEFVRFYINQLGRSHGMVTLRYFEKAYQASPTKEAAELTDFVMVEVAWNEYNKTHKNDRQLVVWKPK